MLYFVDMGCKTDLTSKRIFNQLPRHLLDQHMVCNNHDEMADGTKLHFYGVVKIPIKDKRLEAGRDLSDKPNQQGCHSRHAFPGKL